MIPYGLPRDKNIEEPDLADIRYFGLKSSTGQFRRKSGDFRGYQKSKNRKIARRYWKKKERAKYKNCFDF